MRPSCRSILLIACCLAACGLKAGEQITWSAVARGMRSGGPVELEIEIDRQGTGALDGRLEVLLRRGSRLLLSYRSAEVALGPGAQRFRLLLPAQSVAKPGETLAVQGSFLAATGAIPLAPVVLAVPAERERALLVCVCDPNAPSGDTLLRRLGLDRYHPVRGDRALAAGFLRSGPEEMPDSPLEYLRFDLVTLVHDGFRDLAPAQLSAVAAWAEAGGSVLVAPRGTLAHHHRAFLDRLARSAGIAGGFSAVRGGPGPVMLRPGLGRAVIVPEASAGVESEEGRRAVPFLWKVRREQAEAIRTNHTFLSKADKLPSGHRLWEDLDPPAEESEGVRPLRVAPARLRLEDGLLAALLPEKVRLMPFGELILILVLFLLAIGPLDYLGLGLLRWRRFTWVSVPLLALAFTFVLVQVSRGHLGSATERRSLALIDVGPDGVARRQNRFEVAFTPSSQAMVHPVETAILTALPPGDLTAPAVPAAEIEGRFLLRYDHSLRVGPWRAQLYRSFSLDLAPRPLAPHWDRLPASELFAGLSTQAPLDGRFADLLLGGQRLAGRILVLHRARVLKWTPGAPAFADAAPPQPVPYRRVAGYRVEEVLVPLLSVHPQTGLFSLVAQVSPSGGPLLEDLSLLDPTDPAECLVVVEHRVGGELLVFRKLYREGG